jgi:predicted DNA-binding transcriptional regulator YafY
MIDDYIGRMVQIFYQDSKGNISIRVIKVKDVKDGKVTAFCYAAGAPRVFNESQIIDIESVNRHAG